MAICKECYSKYFNYESDAGERAEHYCSNRCAELVDLRIDKHDLQAQVAELKKLLSYALNESFQRDIVDTDMEHCELDCLEKSGKSYRSHYLVMLSWVKENVLGATVESTIRKELF